MSEDYRLKLKASNTATSQSTKGEGLEKRRKFLVISTGISKKLKLVQKTDKIPVINFVCLRVAIS